MSLKNYVNYYRYWDDEGYSDRAQFLRFYETMAAISEFLLQLYTNNCEIDKYKGNDYLRIADSTAFAKSLKNFPPSISADSTNMEKAYDLYRCFHNNSIEFRLDPTVRSESMYDYLNNQFNSTSCYFNADVEEECLANSTDSMINNLINPFLKKLTGAGTTDFITDNEVNTIYEAANANGEGGTLSQIFDDHGLNMNPYSIAKPIIFTCRTGVTVTSTRVMNYSYADYQVYGEVKGFYIDWYAARPKCNEFDHEFELYYVTDYLHMYMDYCHDDNNIVKHSTSSDDAARTTVLKDVKWTNWTDIIIARWAPD